MQIADRVAYLAEKMFLLERRANSSLFPAKTCRDLKICHPGSPLSNGKYSLIIVTNVHIPGIVDYPLDKNPV